MSRASHLSLTRRPWDPASAGFRGAAVCALAVLLAIGCRSGPRPSDEPAEGSRAGAAPQRIVSLVPAVTEMLFAIGAGPRVVGVSTFDHFPPQVARLPKVGALLDPNLEVIVRLKPDLVAADASQSETLERLEGMQIRTFVYSHPGLSDITKTMRDLGALLDLRAEADRAATTLESRLQAIRVRIGSRRRPKTLLVFGREPSSLRSIYASGGVGFLADILDIAGGRNVFATVRRESLQATTEAILAAAPEVIVELQPGDGQGAERQAETAWQALPAVPAVARRRVYVLVGDEFVVPGPRVAEAAERMARVLHPEAFTRNTP
jgi:iron complex transport system substrate-binding protein